MRIVEGSSTPEVMKFKRNIFLRAVAQTNRSAFDTLRTNGSLRAGPVKS
jgi:hypothetical protein